MKIKIPCSTSNLGPGFDTLGLALNRYLYVSAEMSESLQITVEGNGRDHISVDETNLVYSSMLLAATKVGKSLPSLRLHLKNDIPAYGGLGGSGAAIAGGVFLANEFVHGGLSAEQMLNIAVEIEGHPDNVSAALYGGLTINCFDNNRKVHCRSVPINSPLSVITCSPHFQVQTAQARKILPQQVPLRDAVTNIENAASLVAALMTGDVEALRYVTAEKIHEQYRAALIPGFDAVRQASIHAGALSCNISGAGPTVFAFTQSHESEIASAMRKAFQQSGQDSTAEIMAIENTGITLIA